MINGKLIFTIFLYILPVMIGCTPGAQKNTEQDTVMTEKDYSVFPFPPIPEYFRTGEEQMTFLTHYWNNFDFTDTAYIHLPEVTEKAIIEYLRLIQSVERSAGRTLLNNILDRARPNNKIYTYFTEMFDKYLYDPTSPIRDDELYIGVLQNILDNPDTNYTEGQRLQFRMDNALKNRIDSVATDFKYTLRNGNSSTLHSIQCPYTLIFFHYPDCSHCKEFVIKLNSSETVRKCLENNLLTILAFYPDNNTDMWEKYYDNIPSSWINAYDTERVIESNRLYDLKASPTIYLLDKDKKVILKDTDVNIVTDYLYNRMPVIYK